MLIFFLFFAFYPLLVRFFFLNDRKNIFGYFQDLIIIFQQFLLCLFVSPPVLIIFFTCLDGYLLMDAFLYSQLNLRMRPALFIYLKDSSSLFHSAIAMGLWKFLILLSLKTVYNISILSFFTFALQPSDVIVGLLMCTSYLIVKREDTESINNALFSFEMQMIRKLLRKKAPPLKSTQMPSFLIPQNEHYEFLSSNFPLLRSTSHFPGEKEFDIHLEKKETPHIIFLVLESFGAKYVGSLGSTLPVTPRFDSLSREGLLFSKFYSNGCQTARSIIASLFGVLPFFGFTIGGIPFFDDRPRKTFQPIDCPLIGIPHLLKPYGYSSAYLQNGHLSFDYEDTFLKNRGFETIIGKEELLKEFPTSSRMSWGIHDEYLIRYGAQFLKKADNRGTPTFLSLFTITNHHPWRLPPNYSLNAFSEIENKHLRAYLKTTHYTDHCLGLFIDLLKAEGLLEKSILFIFADHACPMGEHGNKTIQKNIYEENTHIPLLIYAKGRVKSGVIDSLGSQVDLLPTLMDILGIKGIHHSMGHSLMRKSKNKTLFFNNPNEGLYGGLRTKDNKYIWIDHLQKQELFDIKNDPLELNNIADDHPELTSQYYAMTKECLSFCKYLFEDKHFTFQEEKKYQGSSDLTDKQLANEMSHKITHLKLAGCHLLTDRGLTSIAPLCKNLRTLNLKECLVTDQGLDSILKRAKSLENLFIANCHLLTDIGLQTIFARCPHLKFLNASGLTDITDRAVSELKGQTPLEYLDLFHTSLDDKAVETLAKSCPHLQHLRLKSDRLSDLGLKNLATYCPQLSTLKLKRCQNISDEGIFALKTLPLKTLTLSGCEQLTDKGIHALSELSLTSLGLSGIHKLTEEGTRHLINCPLLKLYLGNCSLTDEALQYFKYFPLQRLTLEKCHTLTDKGLDYLKELSHLAVLFILRCPSLSAEATKRLALELHPMTIVLPTFDVFL